MMKAIFDVLPVPARILFVLLFILTTGGCELGVVETTGAIIRVAEATTDLPIEGANVTVAGIIYFGRRSVERMTTRCAPTDAGGQTFVPIVRTNQAPVDMIMDLVITTSQQTIEVQLSRILGAKAVGGNLAVSVVESASDVPAVPIPAPVLGSLATVEINGYVEVISFCRCSDGVPLLTLTPLNSWGSFVDTVSLDDVPEGFEVHTRDGIAGNGAFRVDCPTPLDPLCTSADQTVVAVIEMFESLSCEGERSCFQANAYCVNSEGAVLACAED